MTDKKPESKPVEIVMPPTPKDGNGLAIASLVLGVVSFSGFFIFTGIPAIITGIMSLRRGQKERAMSIAGIVLGSIATLLSLLFVLVVLVIIILGANMSDIPQIDGQYYNDRSVPLESTRT
jgi:MFS family permease